MFQATFCHNGDFLILICIIFDIYIFASFFLKEISESPIERRPSMSLVELKDYYGRIQKQRENDKSRQQNERLESTLRNFRREQLIQRQGAEKSLLIEVRIHVCLRRRSMPCVTIECGSLTAMLEIVQNC